MYPRLSFVVGLAGAAASWVAACAGGGGDGAPTSSVGGVGAAGSGANGAGAMAMGGATSTGSGTTITGPCGMDPNVDGDADGFTPAEGDCDDCDPTVNPGAMDVTAAGDGGAQVAVDHDCDGAAALPATCDDNLAFDDGDAMSAARALDLCQIAPAAPAAKADRRYGVISARWTNATGAEARDPGAQAGILSGFGDAAHPQGGARLLAVSTGRARPPGMPGACGGPSCTTVSNVDAPNGFPQAVPGCDGGTIINDDVALEVTLRAPTNAAGFSFAFRFYSFEFPSWVCTPYNDQFVALVSPEPPGSKAGNVAFGPAYVPVSVNLGLFESCDPKGSADFAVQCGAPVDPSCPAPPSPYCAGGMAALAGTGFDTWGEAGATPWLSTHAPVAGGAEITVRFALWDTTDQALDSTVLLDHFSWIPAGAPVPVGTDPVVAPQ